MIITFANNWNIAVQNGLLRHADLSNVNLHRVNLYGVDLRCADLQYANLSHADLQYADLQYANLQYANLSHADLQYANLHRGNLYGASRNGIEIKNIRTVCGTYDIAYTDTVLVIGCERHTIDEWKKFGYLRIFGMDGMKAVIFWLRNKSKIFNIIEGGVK